MILLCFCIDKYHILKISPSYTKLSSVFPPLAIAQKVLNVHICPKFDPNTARHQKIHDLLYRKLLQNLENLAKSGKKVWVFASSRVKFGHFTHKSPLNWIIVMCKIPYIETFNVMKIRSADKNLLNQDFPLNWDLLNWNPSMYFSRCSEKPLTITFWFDNLCT